MSFSKMVLGLSMILSGTMMSAQERSRGAEGLFASANTETLDYLKSTGSEVVTASFTRNHVNYDLVEHSGKMSMYHANNVFTVSYVNNSKFKVAFRFVDENGNIVYSGASKKGMFHKRFKTAKLPAGSYTAVIVAKDDYYEKAFAIK